MTMDLSKYPNIWCDNCRAIKPMLIDEMLMANQPEGLHNDHDALDLVCADCHFIIATLHAPKPIPAPAEEKVKQKYPRAESYWTSRGWRIINAAAPDEADPVIGRTESGHIPEGDAWADALRRIEQERELAR